MSGTTRDLSQTKFLQLLGGDLLTQEAKVQQWLAQGDVLRAETPLRYPARRGPVVLFVEPSGTGAVRIHDGGGLLESLAEQGMDLSVDMVLSKTVFHAVRQQQRAGISQGRIYMDSSAAALSRDVWRFLQLVAELLGLRYCKYKDALLQLARNQEGPNSAAWEKW